MRVKFYGRLADVAGHELDVRAEAACTIAQLRGQLIADYPLFEDALLNKRVRTCVADQLVGDAYEIGPKDCVEFLAPVSGG